MESERLTHEKLASVHHHCVLDIIIYMNWLLLPFLALNLKISSNVIEERTHFYIFLSYCTSVLSIF